MRLPERPLLGIGAGRQPVGEGRERAVRKAARLLEAPPSGGDVGKPPMADRAPERVEEGAERRQEIAEGEDEEGPSDGEGGKERRPDALPEERRARQKEPARDRVADNAPPPLSQPGTRSSLRSSS